MNIQGSKRGGTNETPHTTLRWVVAVLITILLAVAYSEWPDRPFSLRWRSIFWGIVLPVFAFYFAAGKFMRWWRSRKR